jgi:hypothetical protein
VNRRALLSLANVAVAGVALVAWLRYPQYAYFALYLLFGWFVVSFTLSWTVRGAPAASGPAPAPALGPQAVGTSLRPGPVMAREVPAISFCIYCATDLPPGAGHCPACGRLVVSLS